MQKQDIPAVPGRLRRFKGKAGPGGRFEEQAGDNFSCKEILLPASLEFFCYLEDM